MGNIVKMLEGIGLPFAYDHFAQGEQVVPPFICYLVPSSNNFSADGAVYFKARIVHIELYTDKKDISLEEKIETALDSSGIFYDKSEVWIDSENLYEVLYSFEMEV